MSTWVYTITHNTVCDYFKTKKTIVSLEDDVLLKLKEKERQIIARIERLDLLEQIQLVTNKLTKAQGMPDLNLNFSIRMKNL